MKFIIFNIIKKKHIYFFYLFFNLSPFFLRSETFQVKSNNSSELINIINQINDHPDPGPHTLYLSSEPATIYLTQNLPQINKPLKIIGNGHVIDGQKKHRLFVFNKNGELKNFDVVNGLAQGGAGGTATHCYHLY